jgi:hypothetical protein
MRRRDGEGGGESYFVSNISNMNYFEKKRVKQIK